MSGEPILVVDDNPMNVKLMSYLLEKWGHEVHVAMDAQEALAVLESVRPRLILMDLQLPGMDGLTLTRILKAREDLAGVPVVAVTAFAMKGDEERALEAGCDGYITKPIDIQSLPRMVKDYLDRTQKVRP